MFNLEDTKTIMNIINQKDKEEMLFPVCVKIDQNYYGILELEDLDIIGYNIKIVFGTSLNVFTKKKFPKPQLVFFDNAKMFNYFDEDKQVATEYLYFESDYQDPNEVHSAIAEDINRYCDILIPYVKSILDRNRTDKMKKMMEEQS